jgi:hypothetical protein
MLRDAHETLMNPETEDWDKRLISGSNPSVHAALRLKGARREIGGPWCLPLRGMGFAGAWDAMGFAHEKSAGQEQGRKGNITSFTS